MHVCAEREHNDASDGPLAGVAGAVPVTVIEHGDTEVPLGLVTGHGIVAFKTDSGLEPSWRTRGHRFAAAALVSTRPLAARRSSAAFASVPSETTELRPPNARAIATVMSHSTATSVPFVDASSYPTRDGNHLRHWVDGEA